MNGNSAATTPGVWTIVVPVKRLDTAKSRLNREDDLQRGELAAAFAQDAITAALACQLVARVIAVCDDARMCALLTALGAECVSEGGRTGLNAAMITGVDAARCAGPPPVPVPVAMMAGDLPSLTPGDLAGFLREAARWPRSFAADRSGSGTSILAVTDSSPALPRFGADSAHAHRSSAATDLSSSAGPTLRCDVDTDADLRLARELGLGSFTTAALKI